MQGSSKVVNESKALFTNELIVGNHDSVTLLGAQAQNSLNDYSGKIAGIVFENSEELETAIEEVVLEIEKFESSAAKGMNAFFGKNRRQKSITEEYRALVSYVEKATLYFQLQQIQIAKEIKLLERFQAAVCKCEKELEQCIKQGEDVLRQRELTEQHDGGSRSVYIDSNVELWYSRLKKKIEDLRISHTIALQSQAQIKMLYDSNLMLLDKITAIISNTLPAWKSQITTFGSVKLLAGRLDAQNRVFDFSDKHLGEILEANQRLRKAFDEISSMEENKEIVRKDAQRDIRQIERG